MMRSDDARFGGRRLGGLLAVLVCAGGQSAAADKVEVPRFVMSTVAGCGEPGFSGDRGAAVEAHLDRPTAVAVASDGTLYIADYANQRIRLVTTEGEIETFAGNFRNYTPPLIGDGGRAKAAQLCHPYGVAVSETGVVYIADQQGQRIRMVDTEGKISTFAGGGRRSRLGEEFEPVGDGGAAKRAVLSGPNDVAVDGEGRVLIADSGNNRVRRVDANGVITTVAGTGEAGYSGDGGAAVDAELFHPSALEVMDDGTIYVCDFSNHVVRKISPEGVITTVAGTGEAGFNGDGMAATEAQLNEPGGVAVDAAGNVFIADGVTSRIRMVGPDGIIRTVAGGEKRGYGGDGGPATEAQMLIVDIIDIDADGNLYVTDHRNHRIRKLTRVGGE